MSDVGPRVWAPSAETVELVLPGDSGTEARIRMSRSVGGWWVAETNLAHGTDYAFAVDGGDPRPDPRSRWQPQGVHGPSRALDVDRFAWTDGGWSGRDARGAVVYELHLGTFTPEGTLAAAVGRLDHLVELGVDLVELMPVAAFNGVHGWGYDGVSLFAVHEPYGGPQGLQAFIDAAHARGLAVCLDVVHNHLGPSGNYLGTFGPYFTDTHQTPWGAAVNLDDDGAREVRRWICDSALQWFRDFHVDALRLDAVHALVDESPRHLLSQLADEVGRLATTLGRPLSLIAESDLNDPVSVTPTTQGGWGMTAQWADDVHHAIHALVTGERHGYYVDFGSPEALRIALTRAFVHDGAWSTFRGSRWGRTIPAGTDGHRFVVFASDHDQVGNRALGDRPSERLDPGGLAAEAALVLLSPFTPMLFMGEEWGARTRWQYFTDHPEPDLARAVREGRQAEFGNHGWAALYGAEVTVPDPQSPTTFADSHLDWSEPDDPGHARLEDWYRQLIALRRTVSDLGSGDLAATSVQFRADEPSLAREANETEPGAPWRGWIVVHRGSARVVVNLSDRDRTVPVTLTGPVDVRASWAGCSVTPPRPGGSEATVVLPGRGVAVLA
ncbi:MAG TPA: malto-oligosyltrehalose trehalohydrolase [Cellulomonadaceae bacterium]|nr:malto-oligosyltrehalose trehalohydrolase [Cellulomonadaceae bacterium]